MADEKKIIKKHKKERKFHPIRYLKEMMGEVKKLSWLTPADLVKHTLAVLVFVLIMSAMVYGFDQAFGAGIRGMSLIGANVAEKAQDTDDQGADADHDHDHDDADGEEEPNDPPAP